MTGGRAGCGRERPESEGVCGRGTTGACRVHPVKARDGFENDRQEVDPEPRRPLPDVAHRQHVEVGGALLIEAVAAGAVGPEEDGEVEPERAQEEHEADADEADVHDGVDADLGADQSLKHGVGQSRGRSFRAKTGVGRGGGVGFWLLVGLRCERPHLWQQDVQGRGEDGPEPGEGHGRGHVEDRGLPLRHSTGDDDRMQQ